MLLNKSSPNQPLQEEMEMNLVYAEPIAMTLESVGFLMTLSLVLYFFVVVGCLCLKMYERVFQNQNSKKEGKNTSGRVLNLFSKDS